MPPGKATKTWEHTASARQLDGLPNSSGIATLPVEILRLIVDFIPEFPVPCKALSDRPFLDPTPLLHRAMALKSLAETCRWLRQACLSMAWKSLDVCKDIWRKETLLDYDSQVAMTLTRKLETAKNQGLSAHIRAVNVGLTNYSFHSVFAEFARALSQMPNLHTLQILDFPTVEASKIEKALALAMAEYTYTTVKILSCVVNALAIAPHFPTVEHVTLLHPRPLGSPLNISDLMFAVSDWALNFIYHPPKWLDSGCWDNVVRLDLSSQLYLRVNQCELYETLSRALPKIEVIPFLFPIFKDPEELEFYRERWSSHRQLRHIYLQVDMGVVVDPGDVVFDAVRSVLLSNWDARANTGKPPEITILRRNWFDMLEEPLLNRSSKIMNRDRLALVQCCAESSWYVTYPGRYFVKSYRMLDGQGLETLDFSSYLVHDPHAVPKPDIEIQNMEDKMFDEYWSEQRPPD